MEYWKNYFNNPDNIGNDNFQQNVGRTKNGVPVSNTIWKDTIDYLIKKLHPNKEDSKILELCCGNGQIIGNLAPECKIAVGVDYSEELLNQLKHQFGESVKTINSDVLTVNFDPEFFDIIIVYFAIQHFKEKETIQLIHNALPWLKKGGKIYIGDIPNELKKWEYLNKPEYKKDFIKRILNENPKIGNWFQPKFFLALSDFFEGISVKILKQPSSQINSQYRFDVLISKK